MKWILTAAVAAGAFAIGSPALGRPLLHDPVVLNIGVSCQWQKHCMAAQRSAMMQSLSYVSRKRPPQWRLQLCNRNAARGGYRVDWVGFDNCIHNPVLKRPIRPVRRYSIR
ncbi:MAG TPA: hypothetical protein VGU01_06420 [Sphingomicrobium sp.]|nr:hypothetical protein [Sphingomicrobium sp.]